MIITITPIPDGQNISVFRRRKDIATDPLAMLSSETKVIEIADADWEEIKDKADAILEAVDARLTAA